MGGRSGGVLSRGRRIVRVGLLVLASGAVALIGAACGGGSDEADDTRVLHLGDIDISEGEFRDQFNAEFRSDPEQVDEFCWTIRGLDADEAEDVLSGSRWVVDEGAVPADRLRAAEILLEECHRFTQY